MLRTSINMDIYIIRQPIPSHKTTNVLLKFRDIKVEVGNLNNDKIP